MLFAPPTASGKQNSLDKVIPTSIVLLNMQVITTVTQKGQITLPKNLRDKFKITPYDRVVISHGKRFIKVSPTHDILDLAGTFKPKKGLSVMAAREAFERNYKRV